MVIMLLLLATIGIANAAENAYQALSITLPENLMEHITAIYNNKLYVFGGRNSTFVDSSYTHFYNPRFYRLNLQDKFDLSGTNNSDITHTLNQNEWETLDVDAPTYGDSAGNNEFVCKGQCSVLIDKYLYIVGPYSHNTTSAGTPVNWIYRLDLSQDTPTFAGKDDFVSTIGFDSDVTGHCVTEANGLMYIMNGLIGNANDPPFSPEIKSYDPNTNTQTNLTDMTATDYTPGRQFAGCAPNIGENRIYIFGGKGGDNYKQILGTVTGVDYYTIKTDEWTSRGDEFEWDIGNGNSAISRRNIRCFTSLYKNTIECPGGFGLVGSKAEATATSLIWDILTSTEESVALNTAVFSAGTENYPFYTSTDGSYAASLALVIGGATSASSGSVATDKIQYAVRYSQVTNAPTAAPVAAPTADTTGPTPAPSRSPLCPTCSFAPTTDPTSSPLETGNGDGVEQIHVFLSIIFVMVSVIIYV